MPTTVLKWVRLMASSLVPAFAMPRASRVSVFSRTPGRASVERLLTVQFLMLPALVAYGLLVDPATGHGGIPCLWKLCLGVTCPGCGLSRANAFFVHGHAVEAVAANWLIVPVWFIAIRSFFAECSTLITQGELRHG